MDYFSNNTDDEQIKDYIELNTDNGAELLMKKGNWYYFRRRKDMGEFELYTDLASRKIYLERIRNLMIAFISILTIIFEITFDKISSPIFSGLYIALYIIIALLICANFIPMTKEILRIKKLDI